MATKTYEILTLRKDEAGQAGHWQKKPDSPYGKDSIQESNSSSITEPTSIPSPFARMELARTAFGIAAAASKWEDIPKRYQKIVSDCLDVAEIFFNFPMYSKFVEIIKWDKANLSKYPLKDTELGKAMNKFMQGDNGTYHFDRMDAIYLLNYIGENKPNKTGLNIIGATSPVTMFFSLDNDLSFVSEHIYFTNGDKPFDSEFNPLEKRDLNFIQYMGGISQRYDSSQGGIGAFARDFKALHDYIKTACNRVEKSLDTTATYKPIAVSGKDSDYVNVLGFDIEHQDAKTPQQSDFEIKSTLVTTRRLPLVLPTTDGNVYQGCAYIDADDLWDNTKQAPSRDDNPVDTRILPGTNIKYPYLTVSDFFEDTIIKMPYKLNRDAYFNGNINEEKDECSFLLPLTPTFFKYFTTDDLRKMMEMTVSDSVVKITLQIPIQNYSGKAKKPHIAYTKTYQSNSNREYNIGNTQLAEFGLGVSPLVRTRDAGVADYRIALFDKVGISDIKFFNREKELEGVQQKDRRKFGDVCGVKTFVIEKQNFDRIDVSVGGNHGYIIPLFRTEEGSKKFRFAVDFGTTNTHIAYSIDNERGSSPLDSKPQIARLHENYKADKDIIAAFEDNYLPTDTSTTKLAFPIRSAFAESRPINYNNPTYTLSDGNIPFRYEKVGYVEYLDIQTGENLKWSANKDRIRLYIRNIAFILHNKVLLENGNLKAVQIRWFYPASMSTFVRNMMEEAWKEAYRDYFDSAYNVSDNERLTSMSESIAPYCYYINKGAALGIVTTIDIGGGTTDVYISTGNNNDGLLLSFRFASDAIFGDGYNNNINNNGFVKKYRPIFEDALQNEETLKTAMMNIAQKGNSSELVSFFFSLASLNKPGLDFMKRLVEDQKFKYVFLVFYSAIIYHVACTMKAKGIDMPQTVAFSGNGSKTLQVISPNHNVQEEFVKNIFESVYAKEYPKNQSFSLKFDKERPKEATANGGLEAKAEQVAAKPEWVVLLGTDDSTFVTTETYDGIDQSQKDAIIDSVEKFIKFIPSLNRNNTFGDKYNLDVSILEKILGACRRDLPNYLDLGIKKVERLLAEDKSQTKNVTESLFFFPLVGMLNNLAKEIYAIDGNK